MRSFDRFRPAQGSESLVRQAASLSRAFAIRRSAGNWPPSETTTSWQLVEHTSGRGSVSRFNDDQSKQAVFNRGNIMAHELPTPTESLRVPRRRFMREAALLTSATCLSSSPLLAGLVAPSGGAASAIDTDAMEQALERMTGLAALTNHGPMAAEALVALGRPDAVAVFVEGYKKRFTADYPAARQPVTRENWRAAFSPKPVCANTLTIPNQSTCKPRRMRWRGLIQCSFRQLRRRI